MVCHEGHALDDSVCEFSGITIGINMDRSLGFFNFFKEGLKVA